MLLDKKDERGPLVNFEKGSKTLMTVPQLMCTSLNKMLTTCPMCKADTNPDYCMGWVCKGSGGDMPLILKNLPERASTKVSTYFVHARKADSTCYVLVYTLLRRILGMIFKV